MKRVECSQAIALVFLTFILLSLGGCSQTETSKPSSGRVVEAPESNDEEHPFKVWFVKEKDGQLDYVGVDRKASGDPTIKDAVKDLLNGPSEKEQSDGLRSEVPSGTELIDAKETAEGVELNLSKKFASDGGSDSIEARLEQLRRTVAGVAHDRKVFLDVDGNRMTEAGGEGLEVKQPINGAVGEGSQAEKPVSGAAVEGSQTEKPISGPGVEGSEVKQPVKGAVGEGLEEKQSAREAVGRP